MSLINSMLLDLDARQEQHYGFDNSIINSELKPVVIRRRRRYLKIISLGMVIVSAAAFGLAYFSELRPQAAAKPDSTALAQQKMVSVTTASDSADRTHPAVPTQPESDATPVTVDHRNATVPQHKADKVPASDIIMADKQSVATHGNARDRDSLPHTSVVPPLQESRAGAPQSEHDNATADDPATPVAQAHSVQRKQHLPDKQQTARDYYAIALNYYKQGRLSESIDMFYRTLQLDPEHVKAREILSGILIQHQRREDAEKVLREGIEIDPHQSGLNQLMARLKVEQGLDYQAITILEEQLQQGNTSTDTTALLAQLYQRQGRHEDASRYYRQALMAQPDQGRWWLGLAISLEAQHQLVDAAKAYRLAVNSHLEPQLIEYARQHQQIVDRQLDSP